MIELLYQSSFNGSQVELNQVVNRLNLLYYLEQGKEYLKGKFIMKSTEKSR